MPSIELPVDGQPIRLGRSSASCDLQLSSNRLISRVHVIARYKGGIHSLDVDRVEIHCVGWNAITVHCGGKPYELKKGERFTSDLRDSEILLDVHESRVRVHWPEKPHLGPASSDEDEASPTKRQRAMMRHSTPPSPSPAQTRRQPVSPISPSPAVQALLPSSPPLVATTEPMSNEVPAPTVEIYEDPEPGDENMPPPSTTQPSQAATHILSQNLNASMRSQDLLASPNPDFDDDNDEENDPIIHSFGPFGANLLPRMASFNTGSSPIRRGSPKTSKTPHTDPLQPSRSPGQPSTLSQGFDIQEHIINQLAFSRLSSTPLSTILSHLPRDVGILTKSSLKDVIDDIECVSEIVREGKDAAGKALESEYYYLPEKDQDDKRKELVSNDLMKPGLRACRKQHKVCQSCQFHRRSLIRVQQYFWKKPK